MFYQPEKKITLALLINTRSINRETFYNIAKELYEAMPDFIDGNDNRKESKIRICFNGHSQTVALQAATGFFQRGAYLGDCEPASIKTKQSSTHTNSEIETKSNFTVFPNPFKNQLNFSFTGIQKGKVNLSLYDINGRLIQTMFNGTVEKGSLKQIHVDTRKMTPGIYIVRMNTSTETIHKKLIFDR